MVTDDRASPGQMDSLKKRPPNLLTETFVELASGLGMCMMIEHEIDKIKAESDDDDRVNTRAYRQVADKLDLRANSTDAAAQQLRRRHKKDKACEPNRICDLIRTGDHVFVACKCCGKFRVQVFK